MTKKGQGLSMTTIVIAALALLVLVVLTLIFTGRLNLWNKGMDETMACDNYCTAIGKGFTTGAETSATTGKCASGETLAPGVVIKDTDGNTNYCCCTG
jgi:hypothetical protein